MSKHLITITLLIVLILTTSCSETYIKPHINNISNDCNQISREYNYLIGAYNEQIKKYNNLVNSYNELIKERDFWKNEDLKKAQIIELCKNKQISIPKNKILYTKTFCNNGCDYKLYCTNSMLPFFSCNSKLTIYTNVLKNEIEVCDIIAFSSPEYPSPNSEPYYVIHQIIKIDENGYTTKGIANINPDNYIVQFEDIKGKLIGAEY